jgi:CBS domain-containing protein
LSAIHVSQLSFFAAHAPFDRMEPAHLLWMLERMQLGYYARDEVIVSPEQGRRFLSWRGWCRASKTSPMPAMPIPGWNWWKRMLPGALLAHRASQHHRAVKIQHDWRWRISSSCSV